jgi:arylsulfatase A-like enzyme
MLGLANHGHKINNYERHLVSFLNAQGYETVLCGVQHEIPKSEEGELGYQKRLHENRTNDTHAWDLANARKAADYMKEHKGRPFFLSFGMFSTHRVFPELDGSINPNYVRPPFPLPDNKETREDMAGYLLSAKIADQGIGIVLDALQESGLEDQTLIIYTTDHGLAFPGMKCTLYDTGIGVSLIMKTPDGQRKGEAIDALVSHLDVFPTICDLLNVQKPKWLQGTSMAPLLRGESEKIRDEIFAEITLHGSDVYEPTRCIRTERYKYIRYFGEEEYLGLNIDKSISKDYVFRYGYANQRRVMERLFDLYLDPVERVNRIQEDDYKHVYEDLAKRLEQWMEITSDPLIGLIPHDNV